MSAIFSCREASRLASTAIDGHLSWPKRIEMNFHLVMCSACRTYRRQIIGLDRAVRQRVGSSSVDQNIRLDAAARARLAEALRKIRVE